MKKIIYIIVALILLSLAFWYFIYPAFRVVEVYDSLPASFNESEYGEQVSGTDELESPQLEITQDSDDYNEIEEVAETTSATDTDTTSDTDTTTDKDTDTTSDGDDDTASDEDAHTTSDGDDDVSPPSNEIASSEVGNYVSKPVGIKTTAYHPASGSVRVFVEDGETYVRFENFKTIDGPSLHIYLSKDLDAVDFVDLGGIKGNEGNINYLVPDNVDLSEYKYVLHWCKPFSTLFNYADISTLVR